MKTLDLGTEQYTWAGKDFGPGIVELDENSEECKGLSKRVSEVRSLNRNRINEQTMSQQMAMEMARKNNSPVALVEISPIKPAPVSKLVEQKLFENYKHPDEDDEKEPEENLPPIAGVDKIEKTNVSDKPKPKLVDDDDDED